MAEITRKRVGELQRGVFKILLDYPDGLPAKELLEKLVSVVPPTEFEKSEYPNRPGVRRFEKIVRFATIAPVKAEGSTGSGLKVGRTLCPRLWKKDQMPQVRSRKLRRQLGPRSKSTCRTC